MFLAEMQQAVDTLLADRARQKVLRFFVDLQLALDADGDAAAVTLPAGVGAPARAAAARLQELIAADDGVTADDLFGYLWEDEEVGAQLAELAAFGDED